MAKITILLLTIILTACGFGAGTHGSIKGYQYQVTKDKLDKAVNNVIQKNQNIRRAPLKSYYNDNINYITLKIKSGDNENEYILRYFGDSVNWESSTTSEIFICYAHNKFGKGGSEGQGGLSEKFKKEMTDVFEKEFVNKIDNELFQKHIDTE